MFSETIRALLSRICTILDAKRWPLIDSWKNPNLQVWHATWESSEHRRKVKRYISGVPASREKDNNLSSRCYARYAEPSSPLLNPSFRQ